MEDILVNSFIGLYLGFVLLSDKRHNTWCHRFAPWFIQRSGFNLSWTMFSGPHLMKCTLACHIIFNDNTRAVFNLGKPHPGWGCQTHGKTMETIKRDKYIRDGVRYHIKHFSGIPDIKEVVIIPWYHHPCKPYNAFYKKKTQEIIDSNHRQWGKERERVMKIPTRKEHEMKEIEDIIMKGAY